jgi:RNA recognition motif-containing protein
LLKLSQVKAKTSNNPTHFKHEQTENRSNPQIASSTSLWIGNVDPSVTENTLIKMFSVYGELSNVRCLPEKYCAFVNFKSKDEANKAMNALQVF